MNTNSDTDRPAALDADGSQTFDTEYVERTSDNGDPMMVPKNFVELINSVCFKLHRFTTVDLLLHGIRFVTVLLFASIILPYSLFQILLFILIIVLSVIYVVGKNAFNIDKANAPVNKCRLAAFRTRLADDVSRLRRRRSPPATASSSVRSQTQ